MALQTGSLFVEGEQLAGLPVRLVHTGVDAFFVSTWAEDITVKKLFVPIRRNRQGRMVSGFEKTDFLGESQVDKNRERGL